jgi:hypothetical protein
MVNNRRKLLEQSSVIRKGMPSLAELTDSMIEDEQPQQIVEKVVEVIPENALVRQDDGSYLYKRFIITAWGLNLPEDTTEEEWLEVGNILKGLGSVIQWGVGDWANHAYRVWNVAYDVVANEFEYEVETLYTYASVCRAFETSMRHRGLRFGHHRKVISIKDAQKRMEWLELAAANKWSEKQLGEAIRTSKSRTLPDGIVDLFQRSLKPFQRKLDGLVANAGQGERRQMAEWLRKLADQVEQGLD